MKKKTLLLLSLGVFVLLSIGTSFADSIRDRIETQQARIDQGIRSGELTRREADVVQNNLNYIKGTYAWMKADGRLGPVERDRLNDLLDRNSRMIENRKSNPIIDLRGGFGDRGNIQDRIETQQARIDQGIRSGELTRREADMVQDNLNFIKQQHSRFRGNDGRLGPIERDRLHDLLDRNSRMIENKKHNPIGRLY